MGIFHHVGTFLLFAASILLLITTISAPVVNSIALLKVNIGDGSQVVSFGTFGVCQLGPAGDACSSRTIGYSVMKYMENLDNVDYGDAAVNTADGLTRVMILHPVACALAFIAFLFSAGSGLCGALFASLIAALAWIVTLVVMVTDFVAFGIVKDHVNGDGAGNTAYFSTAMWTILAAMIALFFGMLLVLFTCFSARRHKRAQRSSKVHDAGYAHGHTTTKRHFWQRRNRY